MTGTAPICYKTTALHRRTTLMPATTRTRRLRFRTRGHASRVNGPTARSDGTDDLQGPGMTLDPVLALPIRARTRATRAERSPTASRSAGKLESVRRYATSGRDWTASLRRHRRRGLTYPSMIPTDPDCVLDTTGNPEKSPRRRAESTIHRDDDLRRCCCVSA